MNSCGTPWTSSDLNTILVTGGAGFIGSSLVRMLLSETPCEIVNVDKLTYSGNLASLCEVQSHPRYHFEKLDINDGLSMSKVFAQYRPDAVMHLAAETHVDRSIHGPSEFINTNILGTYQLLEAARLYWEHLPASKRNAFRFLHVSTDEVYGSLGPTGAFTEQTPYSPRSPYAASKAASDHLVKAWHHTYGLPIVMTNCSNNYGPRQFPEKLIPLTILNALTGKTLPVYGDGSNIRDWLHVDDHSRAMLLVLQNGRIGETYNIGGDEDVANLALVKRLCHILDEARPAPYPYERRIAFVKDRPGHDQRYKIDASKIRRELGWKPLQSLDDGLRRTIDWYASNPDWIASVTGTAYTHWIAKQYGDLQ